MTETRGAFGNEGEAEALGVRWVETETGFNDVRKDWYCKGIHEGICTVYQYPIMRHVMHAYR